MAAVLIVGDSSSIPTWVSALHHEGHAVDSVPNFLDLPETGDREREAVDIMVVDVANPDSGEAMPIPHARTMWPNCKILAVTSGYAFRSSAFYRMGLWSPDQLLLRPVNLRVMTATVAFLWAQTRTERIRAAVTSASNCDQIYEGPVNTVRFPEGLPVYD